MKTVTTLDLKANLISMISRSYEFLVKDLKAIPEEKQNEILGGCTRTALDMTAKCAATNQNMALRLAGTPQTRTFGGRERCQSSRLRYLRQDAGISVRDDKSF